MYKIKKICTICKNEFETPKYFKNRKTCSIECRYKQVSISAKIGKNSGRFNHGKIPWNKGLTKENDKRLKLISEKSAQQMKREYENGTRNKFEITKNANKKCRELVKDGNWILQHLDINIRQSNNKINCQNLKTENRLGFQNYKTQLKARKTCAGHSRGGSYIENKMKNILDSLNIQYIEQFKIIHPKLNNSYFIDFIIPQNRIAIECDGEAWHQDEIKDKYRQSIIEYYGWKILRFKGKEIINNIDAVKFNILTNLVKL